MILTTFTTCIMAAYHFHHEGTICPSSYVPTGPDRLSCSPPECGRDRPGLLVCTVSRLVLVWTAVAAAAT